jgi:hypothetical protein
MFMLKQESFWERCRRKTSSSWSSRETLFFFWHETFNDNPSFSPLDQYSIALPGQTS